MRPPRPLGVEGPVELELPSGSFGQFFLADNVKVTLTGPLPPFVTSFWSVGVSSLLWRRHTSLAVSPLTRSGLLQKENCL